MQYLEGEVKKMEALRAASVNGTLSNLSSLTPVKLIQRTFPEIPPQR